MDFATINALRISPSPVVAIETALLLDFPAVLRPVYGAGINGVSPVMLA